MIVNSNSQQYNHCSIADSPTNPPPTSVAGSVYTFASQCKQILQRRLHSCIMHWFAFVHQTAARAERHFSRASPLIFTTTRQCAETMFTSTNQAETQHATCDSLPLKGTYLIFFGGDADCESISREWLASSAVEQALNDVIDTAMSGTGLLESNVQLPRFKAFLTFYYHIYISEQSTSWVHQERPLISSPIIWNIIMQCKTEIINVLQLISGKNTTTFTGHLSERDTSRLGKRSIQSILD